MALSPQFLDELRARVGLVDAISRRVKLQRKGREHTGLCPFHNEKTPSFTVNEDKGFFHCFGCGAHGDVIGFVMRSEHLSFPEAIERLAAEAGLAVPQSSPQERARAEKLKSLGSALEAACVFYEGALAAAAGRAALDYLRRRGLEETTIARFRLGFAPERNALKSHLLKQGYPEAMLLEAGLLARSEERTESYDYFRGRVMFPIADARGHVVAFGARALGEATPKYLNSRESELFHKGRMLYGLAHARRGAAESGRLIVVEGYMDVIALHQAGFNEAVAPLGTALSEAQLALLWRLVDEPILCFDGDAAGVRAAERAAERALPLLAPGKSLRFVHLPAGEDPDSLLRREGGVEAMRALLGEARPLVDLVWECQIAAYPADTPERRARLKERIELTARRIGNDAVQKAYRQELWSRYHQRYRGEGRSAGAVGKPRHQARDWRRPEPAGAHLKGPRRPETLPKLGQEGLVAAIVNRPALLDQLGETFGALELAKGELDNLRREIIKAWAPDIDSEALKNHLLASGYGGVLDRVLTQDGWIAASELSLEEATKAWRHSYDLLSGAAAARDMEKAERDYAEHMTDDGRIRLQAGRREFLALKEHALDHERDELLFRKRKRRR
ncbi:MAG TPA: DNA primase [Alphaproteobacteria bacterium]|nr:DNA primase [Alphaproteobacteria bacterium]